MEVTERGVVAMGGRDIDRNYLKSVELLDWASGQWQLMEPSLRSARDWYGGVVKIPASVFGCVTQQLARIKITKNNPTPADTTSQKTIQTANISGLKNACKPSKCFI